MPQAFPPSTYTRPGRLAAARAKRADTPLSKRKAVPKKEVKRGMIVMVGWNDAADTKGLILGKDGRDFVIAFMGKPQPRSIFNQYVETIEASQIMKIVGTVPGFVI